MNKNPIGLALLFCTFLLCTFSSSPLMEKASAPEDLTAFVEKGMQDWRVPGAAVAVVTANEVLFEKGFGSTAIKGGKAVDTPCSPSPRQLRQCSMPA